MNLANHVDSADICRLFVHAGFRFDIDWWETSAPDELLLIGIFSLVSDWLAWTSEQ